MAKCFEHMGEQTRMVMAKRGGRDPDCLRYINSHGYAMVRRPGKHALPEHRVVMEEKLGRSLARGESVHHINGDRADNDPDNLELWVRPHLAGVRGHELVCPHCGESYS